MDPRFKVLYLHNMEAKERDMLEYTHKEGRELLLLFFTLNS